MTGALAQIIALVSFGNEYLKTGILPVDFYRNNSTFKFANSVTFVEWKKIFFKNTVVNIAPDPIKWFLFLKEDGCKKLQLQFEKNEVLDQDFMSAGAVGGGGIWFIECVYEQYSNYWINNMKVTNKNAQDRRIWSVTYTLIPKKQIKATTKHNEISIRDKFSECLSNIADFAYKNKLIRWGDTFEKAKKNLSDNNPDNGGYYTDFIVEQNYSLPAKQLLFSAKLAWVFGGMGSWNDIWLENADDKKKYDELSAQLYELINEVIITVINDN